MGMVQGEALARHAVEMAAVVSGDAQRRHERPPLSNLIGTVSPLVHDQDGIEAGLVFARAGVPVCYVTMPCLGTTAPASLAGAVVVGAAEIVAAAVLHELAAPGAPVGIDHAHLRRPAHRPGHDRTARRPLPVPRHRVAARLRPARPRPLRWHRRRPQRHLAGRRRGGAAAAPGRPRRLRDVHRHRAHRHLPGVRPREPNSRRRPVPPARATPFSTSPPTTKRWRSRRSTPWARAATFCAAPRPAAHARRRGRAVTQEAGPDGRRYATHSWWRASAPTTSWSDTSRRPWARPSGAELRTIVTAADEALA